MAPPTIPLVQRLERRHQVTDAGCWEWTGALHDGYGIMEIAGRQHRVHRIAWQLFRGEISEGLVIDHLCRNRACFNPEHLRTCTIQENLLAPGSRSMPAIHAAKTHCPRGHPLADENLYIGPTGKRECRTCQRARRDKRRRNRLR